MRDRESSELLGVKRLISPILILAVSTAIFVALVKNQPTLKTTAKQPVPVAIRALDINLTPMQLSVKSEGNVQPSVETKLVAQVAGEVVKISSSLVAGGEFSKGDILLKLDPRDYEIALARSEAALSRAQAEQRFAAEEASRVRSLYGDELTSLSLIHI